MKTEIVKISNTGRGMNEALELTEKFSQTLNLDRKTSSRLRLLTEELFSMVRAITGDFAASFWLEEDNCTAKLHLESKAELDYPKRREILSISTEGKNISQRGIMEKIRGIIEAGIYSIGESFTGYDVFSYGAIGVLDDGMTQAIYSWSMQKYKDDIRAAMSENSDEWDELEKSIIANVADEVQVGVNNNGINIIVVKRLYNNAN